MLEFGNVVRASFGASVVTSAYLVSDSGEEKDTETQDVISFLIKPSSTSFRTSASGGTEAVAKVQGALQETQAVRNALDHVKELVDQLSAGGLTDPEQSTLIRQIKQSLEQAGDAIGRTESNGKPFLGSGGEDLAISIGNGSSITIQSQDLSTHLDTSELSTAKGIASFKETLSAELNGVSGYEDLLKGQLDRVVTSVHIIEYAAESDLGVNTAGIDMDQAMTMAGMAASDAINDASALFGMEDNLDNKIVAALLVAG